MISPETLRRYPFFGQLSDAQLKAVAVAAEEVTWESGTVIFQIGDPAEALYLLKEGSIDLYDRSEDSNQPELTREFLVGEVNPGEPFGISALLEPYKLIASAVASKPSSGIRLDGEKLRQTSTRDLAMGNALLRQLAVAIRDRLTYARVQLAAARP